MITSDCGTLRLARMPGEFGPVIRCTGELTVATVEPLRRELALLEPLNHRASMVNIAGCHRVDVCGALTILEALANRQRMECCFAVVVGHGAALHQFRELGLAGVVPLFETEEIAIAALRGDGIEPPAREDWTEARAHTLARWRSALAALGHASGETVLRRVTSQFAVCALAEEECRRDAGEQGMRCCFCPLFVELGGRPADLGCRSLIDPIIAAVREDDLDSARAQIEAAIRTIEEMPLPDDDGFPPGLRRFWRH